MHWSHVWDLKFVTMTLIAKYYVQPLVPGTWYCARLNLRSSTRFTLPVSYDRLSFIDLPRNICLPVFPPVRHIYATPGTGVL